MYGSLPCTVAALNIKGKTQSTAYYQNVELYEVWNVTLAKGFLLWTGVWYALDMGKVKIITRIVDNLVAAFAWSYHLSQQNVNSDGLKLVLISLDLSSDMKGKKCSFWNFVFIAKKKKKMRRFNKKKFTQKFNNCFWGIKWNFFF